MHALKPLWLEPLLQVRWSKWIIIVMVLGLSYLVAAGQLVFLLFMPSILLTMITLIGAIVMLQRPGWGIVILVIGAVTPPIGISTGTAAQINPAMLLVAGMTVAWIVRMLLLEHQVRLVPTAANGPLLGLVLAALISVLAGWVFGDPQVALPANYLQVQFGGLALVILSAASFWIGANVIRETRWLKIIVGTMVVLGVLAILSVTLPIVPRGLPYLFPGIHGLYWMWAPALAYAQILFNRSLSIRIKLFLMSSILAWVWWAWGNVTDFVAGWLPMFIAILVISWFRSRALSVLLLVALLASLLLRWDYYYERLWVGNQGSFNRLELWTTSINTFGDDQPLLGLGPATYSWYSTAYGLYFRQSHSTYVDLFLQYGLVGLVCFLAVFAAVLKQAWDLKEHWEEGFEKGYVIAVLGGISGALIGSVLADWMLPQVYNVGLNGFRHSMFTWFLAGGLIALRWIKDTSDAEAR